MAKAGEKDAEYVSVTECGACGGTGVDEAKSDALSASACPRCGGSGDLFDGKPWAQHAAEKVKQARERSENQS